MVPLVRLGPPVLVAVLLVGACGAGSSAAARQADAAFLQSVHSEAPDVGTYRSDVQLVRLGHAACDDFRSGASYEQLADRLVLLEGNNALPSQDLGAVITAAVENYCPKYRSIVQ